MNYARPGEHWIECQTCGTPLQQLDEYQRQVVAANPYNFVGFCRPCKEAGAHIEDQFK
jgi:uncharacterized C2H2 Zn-finger protein